MHNDNCTCDIDYTQLKEAEAHHQNEDYNAYFDNQLEASAYED